MIRPSGRIVLASSPSTGICTYQVRLREIQTVRINVLSCCIYKNDMCIAQSEDQVYRMQDALTADYSGATEITFDVWQGGIGGVSLISLSLTGGDITIPTDNSFQFKIDDTVSTALPIGKHYYEAWVVTSAGDKKPVGAGSFRVEDTRKYDA